MSGRRLSKLKNSLGLTPRVGSSPTFCTGPCADVATKGPVGQMRPPRASSRLAGQLASYSSRLRCSLEHVDDPQASRLASWSCAPYVSGTAIDARRRRRRTLASGVVVDRRGVARGARRPSLSRPRHAGRARGAAPARRACSTEQHVDQPLHACSEASLDALARELPSATSHMEVFRRARSPPTVWTCRGLSPAARNGPVLGGAGSRLRWRWQAWDGCCPGALRFSEEIGGGPRGARRHAGRQAVERFGEARVERQVREKRRSPAAGRGPCRVKLTAWPGTSDRRHESERELSRAERVSRPARAKIAERRSVLVRDDPDSGQPPIRGRHSEQGCGAITWIPRARRAIGGEAEAEG